ncbi:MAG: hypothetical protein HOC74_10545 [Gemmatimonadetes bacterium]|jgi:hypothetical protein|nr:hypothetical protein [Gemmatimonadota bacterium]
MAAILGSGDCRYEELDGWGQAPGDCAFREVPDLVVDAQDRVYLFTRDKHQVLVFEADGSYVASWGQNLFTRPHGLTLGPDGNLYCVDDLGHCIRKCSPDGHLLATIGDPEQPAPRRSGVPFNQPTKVAFDPQTGDMYVSDGYGNARVHRYSPDGSLLHSWGEYGTEPGQFNLVHSICVDAEGRVYIADRENHRVQIFDGQGNFLEQWNNLHRPCGLYIHDGLVYIGQLLTHLDVNADYPNLGACVSVHDLTGKQLARLGKAYPGEEPGQFTTPHGLAVDSRGDLYVAEVSWSAYGSRLTPPRQARSIRKLVKI